MNFMKRLLSFLLLLAPLTAHAQNATYATTVSACGMTSNNPVVGTAYPLTMNLNFQLCDTGGGGGGGSNAAAFALGASNPQYGSVTDFVGSGGATTHASPFGSSYGAPFPTFDQQVYNAITTYPIPTQTAKGVDIGATEQVQVTPAVGTASTITTGGTAVTVITGPILGGFVCNGSNAAIQGISTAESIYLDMVGTPGSTDAAANGTTSPIATGQCFTLTALATGVTVKVNAATSGHKLTVNKW